jgi:hypothetical protein
MKILAKKERLALFTVYLAIFSSSITIFSAPVSAHHREGPRPEPQPAPSSWIRENWGLGDGNEGLGKLTGNGVRLAVLDGPLWEGDPLITSLASQRRLIARDFLPGDWGDNNHGNGVVSLVADSKYGIAPGVTLIHARVCAETCIPEAVAAGIRYAVMQKARIIVASFGAVSDDRLVEETLRWAKSKGVLVIAAAGNHGCESCTSVDRAVLPASSPDVISVGAVALMDNNWIAAPFTAAGSNIDLAAPGVDLPAILSGGVRRFSGTSASAPVVGGVAALLLEADPELSVDELAGALAVSAVSAEVGRSKLGGSLVTTKQVIGSGVVDPSAAYQVLLEEREDLATYSPLRKVGKVAQLPAIKSQRWSGEGLSIKFAANVKGEVSLLDATGAPVASSTANSSEVLFPITSYSDMVKWGGRWAVARNGGGITRAFTVTTFPLSTPKIRYIITTERQTRLGWSAIAKANRYAVLIGGQRLVTSSTSLSINNLTAGYASRVQVFAIKGEDNSETMSAPSSVQYSRPSPPAPSAPVVGVSRTQSGINLEVNAPSGSILEFVRSDGAWFEVKSDGKQANLINATALSTVETTMRVRLSIKSGFSWRSGEWSQEIALE